MAKKMVGKKWWLEKEPEKKSWWRLYPDGSKVKIPWPKLRIGEYFFIDKQGNILFREDWPRLRWPKLYHWRIYPNGRITRARKTSLGFTIGDWLRDWTTDIYDNMMYFEDWPEVEKQQKLKPREPSDDDYGDWDDDEYEDDEDDGEYPDLNTLMSMNGVFPDDLKRMLQLWTGNNRTSHDLPDAAKRWFYKHDIHYPGVDGALYRGMKSKKGAGWLVKMLDSGKVDLGRNPLESWTHGINTAMHFMARQESGPYGSTGYNGIVLSQSKVPTNKIVFDFPFVEEYLQESYDLRMGQMFNSLYEKEVITKSICGVCELDDVEMVMYPTGEEGKPVQDALMRAYPKADWVVKVRPKMPFNVVKTSKKKLTVLDPNKPFPGKPNRKPGKYGRK